MKEKRKILYIAAVMVFGAAMLTFRPGMWLVDKPASTENSYYVKGWADGCVSGTNSYSLLYAPLMERPFVKELEVTPELGSNVTAAAGKDYYKTAWNEGFTECRFYQSAVYDLMQFAIVVATLLFIGYLLARKQRA